MARSHCFVAGLMLVGLAGCALVEPTDPYGPTRPAAIPAVQGAVSAQGGSPAAGQEISLADALRIALANNPDVAARRFGIDAAHAERDVAAGERWPSLHAIGGYTHYLDNARLIQPTRNNQPGTFSNDILGADMVLSVPIFTGGRIANNIRAAELLQAASEHRLARTRRELVFNVSSVFYDILGRRHVIESVEFSRKALAEHCKRVQDLLHSQRAAKVDLLRTEVRLADVDQQLVRERNVLAIQHRLLASLLGMRGGQTPLVVKGALELIAAAPDLHKSLAQAYGAREDFLAARARLEAQAKRVDAARAGHWPTVSLRAAYGGRQVVGSSAHGTGVDDTEDLGQAGVVMDVPLFEGGRIRARVRQERAKLREARELLRKLELQVGLEVETAVLNVASTRERVDATEKAIEQAKESLRIERQKYELGKGSITDVLDAQSALLDAQTNYYRALAEYNISLAQLRLATGEEV